RSCGAHTGDERATGKSFGNGAKSTARSMNRRQIVAGNVGPDTEIPCTDVIGISPLGKPIHTVASSEGVNPQNQASAKLSVVPVFPADVRPKYAPRPVPEVMFSSRIRVTSAATQSGTTRLRFGTPHPASVSTLPPGRTTFRIAIGFE